MPMTKCSWCEEETSRVCLICSRPFCQDHASTEQDEFCLECAASPEESRIETTELCIRGVLFEPLVHTLSARPGKSLV